MAASARRAARPGADAGAEEARLIADLAASLPGAEAVEVAVTIGPASARSTARFRWLPPGPDWRRPTITVSAVIPRVVPP